VSCNAGGHPTPLVSLYLGGEEVASKVTTHLVTTVNNITREEDQLDCYVDNGYGNPRVATRHIRVQSEQESN